MIFSLSFMEYVICTLFGQITDYVINLLMLSPAVASFHTAEKHYSMQSMKDNKQ